MSEYALEDVEDAANKINRKEELCARM